jgi:SWI/SNF-related matrix-associated actin-dependent regulator of chromatin subfamily A member 5
MVLAVAQKSKYFSRESDIVLLCLTHEHGYGNWTAIKQAIRRDTRCRFDHLFMSRSEQDLQRRLDILVKALEKEQTDKINGVTKVTKAMSKTNLEPKEGDEN